MTQLRIHLGFLTLSLVGLSGRVGSTAGACLKGPFSGSQVKSTRKQRPFFRPLYFSSVFFSYFRGPTLGPAKALPRICLPKLSAGELRAILGVNSYSNSSVCREKASIFQKFLGRLRRIFLLLEGFFLVSKNLGRGGGRFIAIL